LSHTCLFLCQQRQSQRNLTERADVRHIGQHTAGFDVVLVVDIRPVSFKYRRGSSPERGIDISFARGIARLVCYVLGFLFVLGGLGATLVSPAVGGSLFLFGIILVVVGKLIPKAPEAAAPVTQVNVYQQAPPMVYAAPAQQTYVTERETVKVRCRNCGSLNFETANACASCGAPM